MNSWELQMVKIDVDNMANQLRILEAVIHSKNAVEVWVDAKSPP